MRRWVPRIGSLAPVALLCAASMACAAGPTADLALDARGGLVGQVALSHGRELSPAVATRVGLWREGRLAAEAWTDCEGRFRVSGLNAGIYQVALTREKPAGAAGPGPAPHLATLRLWTPGAAPPGAAAQCRLILPVSEPPIVRGQAIPGLGSADLLAVAGLVAGGLAAPVIYASKQDVWIPATP